MKERFDENGMMIGDGNTHCTFNIEDFTGYPIKATVSESLSTESVYVTYLNTETLALAKVRFSSHICNDVKFGAVVDGRSSDARNEILYRLGFLNRRTVYKKFNWISRQSVAKKKLHLYEECDKTFEELRSLPTGTDISEYKGKLLKGTAEVITCDKVFELFSKVGKIEYYEK